MEGSVQGCENGVQICGGFCVAKLCSQYPIPKWVFDTETVTKVEGCTADRTGFEGGRDTRWWAMEGLGGL